MEIDKLSEGILNLVCIFVHRMYMHLRSEKVWNLVTGLSRRTERVIQDFDAKLNQFLSVLKYEVCYSAVWIYTFCSQLIKMFATFNTSVPNPDNRSLSWWFDQVTSDCNGLHHYSSIKEDNFGSGELIWRQLKDGSAFSIQRISDLGLS